MKTEAEVEEMRRRLSFSVRFRPDLDNHEQWVKILALDWVLGNEPDDLLLKRAKVVE